jgi:hypothetical protein
MSTKEVTMTLQMNERCPIHNACRWEQLWRQREFASPVREGINQIRACRFWRGIPEPTSQETRVPISPTSVGAELLRFAVPPTIERAFDFSTIGGLALPAVRVYGCSSSIWLQRRRGRLALGRKSLVFVSSPSSGLPASA